MTRGLYPAPDDEEPMPCRNCNTPPTIFPPGEDMGRYDWAITCTNDDCPTIVTGAWGDTKELAISAWNMGQQDEEPPVSVSAAAASLPRADAPLKPCAHCGGTMHMTSYHRNAWIAYCDGCSMRTGIHERKRDAIAAWNRRDGEDARIAEAKAQGAAEERARILQGIDALELAYNIDSMVTFPAHGDKREALNRVRIIIEGVTVIE